MGICDHEANPDTRAKTNHRGCDHRPGGRANVNHSGVIDRYVDNLRVRRLDYINCLTSRLLHFHRLLRIAAQRSGIVGLRPQALNRRRNRLLIGGKRLADRSIVIDVLGHHVQHLREIHQRDKRRIEPLLLCCLCQGTPCEPMVLLQPGVDIQNLLRIRRRGSDLREQGIRVKRHWSQKLVQLLGCGHSLLGRKKRHKPLQPDQ